MSHVPKLTLTEILMRTEPGESFFTATKDTVVGSYAARAGVKVSTERMLAIHAGKRELTDITRVTVLEVGQSPLVRKEKTIQRAALATRARNVRPG